MKTLKFLFIFTCLFFIEYSYAQSTVSSIDKPPKYANGGSLNLGENGVVFWFKGNLTGAKGTFGVAQLIKEGKQVWQVEIPEYDDYSFLKEMVIASQDGEYVYFIYEKWSNNKPSSKRLLLQIDSEGETTELKPDFPSSIENIKGVYSDETGLHFYCSAKSSYEYRKEEFSKFEPVIVHLAYDTEETSTVILELDKVENGDENTLWEVKGFRDDVAYFSREEIYDEQIKIWVKGIDFNGKEVSSSQFDLTIDEFASRGINIENNTIPKLTNQILFENIGEQNQRMAANGMISTYLDLDEMKLFVLHNEGARLKPSLTVHILDVNANKASKASGIKIGANNSGQNTAYTNVIVDFGAKKLLVFADKGELVEVSNDGQVKNSKLDLKLLRRVKFPLSFYGSSSAVPFVEDNSKNFRLPMNETWFPCVVTKNGSTEYLFFYNAKTKTADVLQL